MRGQLADRSAGRGVLSSAYAQLLSGMKRRTGTENRNDARNID